MKTAVELYEAFLIELDHHGSPNAQVIEFLHFWNRATYAFIENELKDYELTNTVSDRLRMISHSNSFDLNQGGCSAPVKELNIPSDYFRLFGVKGTFEYARDHGFVFKKGEKFVRAITKLTADIEGFILENEFYKPSLKRPYYQILNNKIEFLYEDELKPSTEVFIRKVSLRYVKHPVPLSLSDDFQSYNSSPFPVDVNHLILGLAVLLFMGTSEDQRIQLKSKL